MDTEVSNIDFQINDYVVYPSHGVGRIIDEEVQNVAGFELAMYVVTFEKDKMTLKVPKDKIESTGMRKLSTPNTIGKALQVIGGKAKVKRAMWSRRAQDYEQKINSGELILIAEVVRDLHRNDEQREQSYSERQLYEAALERLTREIAAVDGVEEQKAQEKVDKVLDGKAA
jgi:CarD family transcriptional regulator